MYHSPNPSSSRELVEPVINVPMDVDASHSTNSATGYQVDDSRLRRLLWIFCGLLAVLVAPTVVGSVQYARIRAEERARFEVARENLQEINLSQVSTASRLLAQYVGPSVVNLRTATTSGLGQGSGVIVDEQGYIVTNHHVVAGVGSVEVQLSDGRRGNATLIGADPLVDVAVLKTELGNLTAAKWGNSDQLNVGELVWALGSPFGLQKSITMGILSAKERREITSASGSPYQEFLQTDAAVNPGNSGGPLVNVRGEVVGINTAIIGPSYQGISFSIPSEIARASYEKLREEGWVQRGYLGVAPARITQRLAQRFGLEQDYGVLVVRVQPNTPASQAGIEVGDVILSWNGAEYSDPVLLSRAIAATEIGAKVPVKILRKSDPKAGKEMTLTVTVATRPPESL